MLALAGDFVARGVLGAVVAIDIGPGGCAAGAGLGGGAVDELTDR
jgi:hypothetical protein